MQNCKRKCSIKIMKMEIQKEKQILTLLSNYIFKKTNTIKVDKKIIGMKI